MGRWLRSARAHAAAMAARLARVSPIVWALLGVALSLQGCADGGAGGDLVRILLSNAPGIAAAVGIALRAQARIRISDAERERIATAAHAEAVSTMSETIRAMRADMATAAHAVEEALRRERAAEDLARKLDGRCDSMARELDELRRVLRAGGIRVSG